MNKTIVKPADPEEPAQAEKQQQEEPPDLFMQQIEERASTQTQVLLGVLERDQVGRWRHWGINE